jgi:hypothetical protein
MARIVSYAHRYKRPPKKRKASALEVPTVVTSKRSRRSAGEGARAAAESIPRSPRLHGGAAQPSTFRNTESDSSVTTPPPVQKSAIVTA